ncbi:MAG: DUF3179 domain-containing protein [Cyclobacteriaceae bacterium]
MNGFNLEGSLVPAMEIMKGGPPKDGIPSIDRPLFTVAKESGFTNESQVLGVLYNGIAKAYPIGILNWHEIVNDVFAGVPVSVTYCPLCGSGMAYLGKINDKKITFGVSGLLYNSDVLLYDRSTGSLWSQILNKAVTGEMRGKELTRITTQRTSLGAWKELHPETLVLSTETGFPRDYQRTPYAGYDKSAQLYFPIKEKSVILHQKELVLGLEVNGKYKAYPISKLADYDDRILVDKIGGEKVTLSWDLNAENIEIKDSQGQEVIGIQLFWFAWYAFHSDSEVWSLY